MARSKFGQYFRAEAVGLARETETPDTQGAGDLGESSSISRTGVALNGQRTTAGPVNGTRQIRSRAGLTLPQRHALALAVISTGTAALVGSLTWSTLIPIGVSALLSGVVWTASGSLLAALRSADSAAVTRQELVDLERGQSRPARLGSRHAGLLLAIAATLLWLVWVRPGALAGWTGRRRHGRAGHLAAAAA